MQRITTFLWYDTEAEEAANFYTSIFDDGKITKVTHYGSAGPREAGMVMTVEFELAGLQLIALNGGPQNTFNESVSLMVHCDSQDEVDRYWARLSDGGEEGACGWLKDRYGLSWQIVPTLLLELMDDPDPVKSQAVMAAMLKMNKLESSVFQEVYDNA